MKTTHRIARAAALAAALAFTPSIARAADDAKNVAFLSGTTPFADVLAQAKKEGKPVFIDFQTSWCGWCRRLEKDVFSQSAVGDLMKSFVNVSYDAEKGEGKDLAERFRVHGFPTLVIVGADGNEIDRLEGYRPPDAFTSEIERIKKGEDTIPALRKKAADAPGDVGAKMALARKLTAAAPANAVALLDEVIESAKGKDRALEAEAWISLARAARNANDKVRAEAACDRVLSDFADTDYAAEALQAAIPPRDPDAALAFLLKVRKDSKNARLSAYADAVVAEVHLQAAAAALRNRAEAVSNDPQALNEIAWTCFERKMNLKPAVGWARKAVEMSKRDPAILDTLGNLLYATGQLDEAVNVEREAVETAKADELKAEFGETLAKLQAVASFRRDHPIAIPASFEEREDEGAAAGETDSSGMPGATPVTPSDGAKRPATK